MRPIRLQLSRKKGFDLQALSLATNGLEAVKVTRPGIWGNPWRIGITRCTGRGETFKCEAVADAEIAVRFFREMVSSEGRAYPEDGEIRELRGKNLACWCKIGEPCHANILLELSNR